MPLGNGRRTFHKCCGSLYPPQTVDALLRFPARVRINDRLGARRSAAPSLHQTASPIRGLDRFFGIKVERAGRLLLGPQRNASLGITNFAC